MATDESQAGRIAELERALAKKERELEATRQDLTRFRRLVELAPVGMYQNDGTGRCLYVNAAYLEISGMRGDEPLGDGWTKLFHPDDIAGIDADFRKSVAAGKTFSADYRLMRPDGEERWVHGQTTPIRGDDGQVLGYVGSMIDITARHREREGQKSVQSDLEARVIASQEALIRELSTPIIPIADGVLAMPLVGSIGAARGEQIMEALLAGVADEGAHVAILDITGVGTIDAQAAEALVRAARATRLLGAEVVVTGIGPAVAQTLLQLGVDLQRVVTRGTLQAGIAYALGKVKDMRR